MLFSRNKKLLRDGIYAKVIPESECWLFFFKT